MKKIISLVLVLVGLALSGVASAEVFGGGIPPEVCAKC